MLMKALGKVVQTEAASKILQNEALMNQILKAVSASLEAKDALGEQYEQTLRTFSLAPLARVEELAEQLDHLEAEASSLKKQLIQLATHKRDQLVAQSDLKALQEALESAEKNVQDLTEENQRLSSEVDRLSAQLVQVEAKQVEVKPIAPVKKAKAKKAPVKKAEAKKASVKKTEAKKASVKKTTPTWNRKMTKKQLVSIAKDLGLDVTPSQKKDEILLQLTQSQN